MDLKVAFSRPILKLNYV